MPGPPLQIALRRRDALALALASVAGAGVTPLTSGVAQAASPLSLLDDVVRYASFGHHLTGSPANLAALAWLASRLASLGYSIERQPISYPDHRITSAALALGRRQFDGIAQRPACPTPGAGLTARLALAQGIGRETGLQGAIAVLRLPYARHSSIQEARIAGPIAAAIDGGAVGLVLVTQGPSGEALALNAPLEHRVGAVPALAVAPRDAAGILSAAARGDTATLRIDGEAMVAASANLIARRPGRGRIVVVTTPLSGWFACAGERGSGIAAFLRLAALLASRAPEANLMFVGTVGHERENVGGERFLATRGPTADDVRLWIHIGANFAARDWQEASDTLLLPLPAADAQRYLLAPVGWLATIRPALRGLPGLEMPYPATVENAVGEALSILRHGHVRLITNFGAHRLHHARTDLPEAVDAASLEASWTGWSAAVLALLDGPAAR
jgi:hypothetical protein